MLGGEILKCPNCGLENEDGAKFCKSCGEKLQKNSTANDSVFEQKSNKNILIICATVIICVIVIAGAIVLLSNGSNDSVSSNGEVNDDSVSADENVDDTSSESNGMRIISGSIYSGGYSTDGRIVCNVYVGTEHANEHVKISVLYKQNARALNQGNIVPTTVTGDGHVIVKTADTIREMPDYAQINLYDENGNLLDNRIEDLDDSGITEF